MAEPFGMPRLSGNVLLWEQDGLTLRLEGRLDKEQALDITQRPVTPPSKGETEQVGRTEVPVVANATDIELLLETESDRVTAWRACELLKADTSRSLPSIWPSTTRSTSLCPRARRARLPA